MIYDFHGLYRKIHDWCKFIAVIKKIQIPNSTILDNDNLQKVNEINNFFYNIKQCNQGLLKEISNHTECISEYETKCVTFVFIETYKT